MAGIVNVDIGEDIPVELQIADGNNAQFPQAEIRDDENPPNLIITLDLVHIASGLYCPVNNYPMPDKKWVTCTYIVYEDAIHNTESTTYIRDADVFIKTISSDLQKIRAIVSFIRLKVL